MARVSYDEYLISHRDQFERELVDLLRIPSISAEPNRNDEMIRATDWLVKKFHAIGFDAEKIKTKGPPIVYAESPTIEGAPTALVYGHYDVQPADPLEEWLSPPFEPTVRDGNLYARGATDDKGQMLTHVFSAQSWVETEGRLPMNLKYLIEGEEEVGSENLEHYLRSNTERLACDCVVISDSAQFAPSQPAITYGLRGIAYCEILLRGPNRDLHSGSFGGSVMNPANALTRLLSELINEQGAVQIPGFYDDVVPLSNTERKQLADLPFDEREYLDQIGVSEPMGESGYTTLERRWARPTFDIHGLTAGYQGKWSKTIIPSSASAKVSFRLVPNQDPEKILDSLEQLLPELCPRGVTFEFTRHHGAPGVVVPLESPSIRAAARAIEYAFGRPPVFTREGGSIPIVSSFHEALGVDTLLLGWGQDDDNTHSPNEKFSLADFHLGIRASARLWHELSLLEPNCYGSSQK